MHPKPDALTQATEVGVSEPQLTETKDDQAGNSQPKMFTPPVPYPSGWRLWVIVVSLLFGTLLVAIDNTIIGTVVPKISTVFNALDDVGWYGSSYLLTVTALQPTFGNMYKYFNVKLTYLISILIFEAGSILCAAAPNSPAFIIGRAIAGVGAAGIFQGALGIIGLTVPLTKRPLYFGIVVSVFGFATCFGPILGGALTDHASWRWCFWINVPIGGVACFLILIFLKLSGAESEDRRLPIKAKWQHMDVFGALTLIASVCCLLLALQWGGVTYAWKSAKIIGLFIGFGMLAIVFGVLQWKLGEKATIPLRILRQRSVLMGGLYVALLNMSIYTYAFYMPFYFQAVQGVSATTSGIRFIPLAFPEVIAIVISGALTSVTGHYVPFMVLAVIVGAVGGGLLTLLGLETTTVQWAAYLVIAGFGLGIGIQHPYSAIQVVLSDTDVPIGNAITVFFTQLGGAVAISIGQTIFLNSLITEVPKSVNGISPQAAFRAGATSLPLLAPDPDTLRALRGAYSRAVVDVLYLALGTTAAALPFALAMEWKNVKKAGKQRMAEASEKDAGKTEDLALKA